MTRRFNGCKGKTLCSENEAECRTCGRSLDEIYTTRRIIDELAGLIVDTGYENSHDFIFYVAGKVSKKVAHLNTRKLQALDNGCH